MATFFYTFGNLFSQITTLSAIWQLFFTEGMSKSLVWINEKSVIPHVISLPHVSRGENGQCEANWQSEICETALQIKVLCRTI